MAPASDVPPYRGPIVDVHLHAFAVDQPGPGRPGAVPAAVSVGFGADLAHDGRRPWRSVLAELRTQPRADVPIWAAETTDQLRRRTLATMADLDIRGVVSGPPDLVRTYRELAQDRVIPGIEFDLARFDHSPDDVAALLDEGFAVLGEITDQYNGTRMDDPRFDPYWQVAADHDVPVAIHTGVGPPGAPTLYPGFRAALHSPLGLERLLNRHPELRVWACHAAWPMLDDLKVMLYNYPQLHVDTGSLQMVIPRTEYYRFLEALVDSGFGDRIMFGSDQIVYPELIEIGVQAINEAPFLTPAQKTAILHDNAVRFPHLEAPDGMPPHSEEYQQNRRPG